MRTPIPRPRHAAGETGAGFGIGAAARDFISDPAWRATTPSHRVSPDYGSAGLGGYPPKNVVSTVDGQMQSSRPPSGPVRNPWTAPGGMKTNVPGPTPSAGAVPVWKV
jgi:hypothetical protein